MYVMSCIEDMIAIECIWMNDNKRTATSLEL
jgi:hypothetical protein